MIKQLEIISEAARGVPVQFRGKYPDNPWRQTSGIHGRKIHGYYGIDMEIVWKTVKEDVPDIIPLLENVLEIEDESA